MSLSRNSSWCWWQATRHHTSVVWLYRVEWSCGKRGEREKFLHCYYYSLLAKLRQFPDDAIVDTVLTSMPSSWRDPLVCPSKRLPFPVVQERKERERKRDTCTIGRTEGIYIGQKGKIIFYTPSATLLGHYLIPPRRVLSTFVCVCLWEISKRAERKVCILLFYLYFFCLYRLLLLIPSFLQLYIALHLSDSDFLKFFFWEAVWCLFLIFWLFLGIKREREKITIFRFPLRFSKEFRRVRCLCAGELFITR